ncbi:MAG: 16S rRNA (uracil(1498)-N(3))-methyltransferase [Candidatus Binatia bacterium]|nr:16S rRNA (uracil(1498)-N(3))-methyltransferase [Candidatus Binatia bacterium]
MTLPTFIAAPFSVGIGSTLNLHGREFHHLRVRRLRPGSEVRVIDGTGASFVATVETIGRTEATLRICRALPFAGESHLEITLAIAMIRPERLEYALEKATELGAIRIIIFACERSRPAAVGARLRRWQRILQEATKQCQRSCVPAISSCASVQTLIEQTRPTFGLLLDEQETLENHLPQNPLPLEPPPRVTVVVGPEGGFSVEERLRFREAGFVSLHLGPRILRTETAAVVGLTLAQFWWGDLRVCSSVGDKLRAEARPRSIQS